MESLGIAVPHQSDKENCPPSIISWSALSEHPHILEFPDHSLRIIALEGPGIQPVTTVSAYQASSFLLVAPSVRSGCQAGSRTVRKSLRNRVSPSSCITDVKVGAIDLWASSNTRSLKSARNS